MPGRAWPPSGSRVESGRHRQGSSWHRRRLPPPPRGSRPGPAGEEGGPAGPGLERGTDRGAELPTGTPGGRGPGPARPPEEHPSVASCTRPEWNRTRNLGMRQNPGPNPQPSGCAGRCSNQLSRGRGAPRFSFQPHRTPRPRRVGNATPGLEARPSLHTARPGARPAPAPASAVGGSPAQRSDRAQSGTGPRAAHTCHARPARAPRRDAVPATPRGQASGDSSRPASHGPVRAHPCTSPHPHPASLLRATVLGAREAEATRPVHSGENGQEAGCPRRALLGTSRAATPAEGTEA